MEMITMPDGARLATWSAGSVTDLPPVVLLHGASGPGDQLAPLAALIDQDTLVHRYDQRGCGRSDPCPESGLTLEQYIADLETLREHWGHDSWVVIGHVAGTALALAYAAAHPDRVTALGYLCGTGVGGRHPAEQGADAGENHAGGRRLRVADADQIGAVVGLNAPCWFIHGLADPRPVANVLELANHARTPRKRVIEGAGHQPWIQQPERTREVLLEVLHSAG